MHFLIAWLLVICLLIRRTEYFDALDRSGANLHAAAAGDCGRMFCRASRPFHLHGAILAGCGRGCSALAGRSLIVKRPADCAAGHWLSPRSQGLPSWLDKEDGIRARPLAVRASPA